MQSKKRIPLKLYQKGSIKVGQAPGTLTRLVEETTIPVRITLFDYDQDNCEERQIETIVELRHLKDKPTNTWINVDGISGWVSPS